MCLRGASAIEKILEERAGKPLRVLVVWEPVIKTDLGPPAGRTLALVSDARAIQFWDPTLSLSQEIVRSLRANPNDRPAEVEDEDAIFWDHVALFPAGGRWETESFPESTFSMSPVVEALAELRARL